MLCEMGHVSSPVLCEAPNIMQRGVQEKLMRELLAACLAYNIEYRWTKLSMHPLANKHKAPEA